MIERPDIESRTPREALELISATCNIEVSDAPQWPWLVALKVWESAAVLQGYSDHNYMAWAPEPAPGYKSELEALHDISQINFENGACGAYVLANHLPTQVWDMVNDLEMKEDLESATLYWR